VVGLAILWGSVTAGAAAPPETVVVADDQPAVEQVPPPPILPSDAAIPAPPILPSDATVPVPPIVPSDVAVPVPFHVPYIPQDRSWMIEGCKAALADRDPDVRLRALKKLSDLGALGQINAADATARLIESGEYQRDESLPKTWIRVFLIKAAFSDGRDGRALTDGQKAALKPILQGLFERVPDLRMKLVAIWGLGKSGLGGEPHAQEAMRILTGHALSDYSIRREAAQALVVLGGDVETQLDQAMRGFRAKGDLKALEQAKRSREAALACMMEDPQLAVRRAAELLALLGSDDPGARDDAAFAFGLVCRADRKCLADLRPLLENDTRPGVQIAALRALRATGTVASAESEAVLALLRRPTADALSRAEALRVAHTFGLRREIAPDVAKALGDEEAIVRQAVAEIGAAWEATAAIDPSDWWYSSGMGRTRSEAQAAIQILRTEVSRAKPDLGLTVRIAVESYLKAAAPQYGASTADYDHASENVSNVLAVLRLLGQGATTAAPEVEKLAQAPPRFSYPYSDLPMDARVTIAMIGPGDRLPEQLFGLFSWYQSNLRLQSALRGLGAPARSQILRFIVNMKEPERRLTALSLLPSISHGEAAELGLLVDAFERAEREEPEEKAATSATSLLVLAMCDRANPSRAAWIAKSLGPENDPRIRSAAVNALGIMGKAAHNQVRDLVKLLRDQSSQPGLSNTMAVAHPYLISWIENTPILTIDPWVRPGPQIYSMPGPASLDPDGTRVRWSIGETLGDPLATSLAFILAPTLTRFDRFPHSVVEFRVVTPMPTPFLSPQFVYSPDPPHAPIPEWQMPDSWWRPWEPSGKPSGVVSTGLPVRYQAARALLAMGVEDDPDAIAALASLLDQKEPPTIRVAGLQATAALGRAARERVPDLPERLTDMLKERAHVDVVRATLATLGPLSILEIARLLNLVDSDKSHSADIRFLAYLVGGGDFDKRTIVAWLANPSLTPNFLPTQAPSGAEAARILADLQQVWDLPGLNDSLRTDIADRVARLAEDTRVDWTKSVDTLIAWAAKLHAKKMDQARSLAVSVEWIATHNRVNSLEDVKRLLGWANELHLNWPDQARNIADHVVDGALDPGFGGAYDEDGLADVAKALAPNWSRGAGLVRDRIAARDNRRWWDWARLVLITVAAILAIAYVSFWAAIAGIYPDSDLARTVVFERPWLRRTLGLGLAVPVLTAIPATCRRLLARYTRSLEAAAKPVEFPERNYFPKSRVWDRRENKYLGLLDAIPAIEGRILLEGASGLGKSMYLRRLVTHSRRPVA
jgi:hypothetical protein